MSPFRPFPLSICCAALALASASAHAQSLERLSLGAAGEGNDAAFAEAVSGDGRVVAFASQGSNWVVNDFNGASDVFVRLRASSITQRVSVSSAGVEGNGTSGGAALSADGRFVAFTSAADNLVVGDSNAHEDIFLRDRQNGTTERISVATGGTQANLSSTQAAISADGRYVAFVSFASNLVGGDSNGFGDVFVRDRQLATTVRVSVGAGGVQSNANLWDYVPDVSASGRQVVFSSSASNLVANDTNGLPDVFVHDLDTATTTRVSVASGGVQAAGLVRDARISGNGRYVVYTGTASNLVPGDGNGLADIFLHDRQTAQTRRLNVGPGGAEANATSEDPDISSDGSTIVFASEASSLVQDEALSEIDFDIFATSASGSTVRRISLRSNGGEPDDASERPAVSPNGELAIFDSRATDLIPGDTNGQRDVFGRGGVGDLIFGGSVNGGFEGP